MKSVLGESPEREAVLKLPEILYSTDSSNLLEAIISMVKCSNAPSAADQERLKLLEVMPETVRSLISVAFAEEGKKDF